MSGEQVVEVARHHLGQHRRGEGPDAQRPGLAVHAARLKPADPARPAEPAPRSEYLDRALEDYVEGAAAAAGLKHTLSGAEPPSLGELEDCRPVRLGGVRQQYPRYLRPISIFRLPGGVVEE